MNNYSLFKINLKSFKEITISINKNLNNFYLIFRLRKKWMQSIDQKKYKEV